MPYERPTLLKVTIHTVKCDPVKRFQSPCQKWALLEDIRPFTWNATLLKDLQITIKSTLIQRIYLNRLQLLESNSKTWSDTNLQLYLQISDLSVSPPFFFTYTHCNSDSLFTLQAFISFNPSCFTCQCSLLSRSLDEANPYVSFSLTFSHLKTFSSWPTIP
jgi:hypothetical protein